MISIKLFYSRRMESSTLRGYAGGAVAPGFRQYVASAAASSATAGQTNFTNFVVLHSTEKRYSFKILRKLRLFYTKTYKVKINLYEKTPI